MDWERRRRSEFVPYTTRREVSEHEFALLLKGPFEPEEVSSWMIRWMYVVIVNTKPSEEGEIL